MKLRVGLLGSFVLLILFSPPISARFQNVRVSEPQSTDPEEVTISINPADPLNLAAGANIMYHYYSYDGGLTWTQGVLSSSLGVWGDPVVEFDGDGNLFFSHLSLPSGGSWLDRIVVQKSTDGGASWDDGVGVGLNPPKQQDKEWLTADLTDSPFQNHLYMGWTEFDAIGSSSPNDSSRILFSRSTNSGSDWATPIRLSERSGDCQDGDNTVEGIVPAVGPNGEVYVSWTGHGNLYFDRSTDGGLTFGSDRIVTTQPGGWNFDIPGIYRCNGFPITACDISGSSYRGNVYICWSDQRSGTDDTDVFFIRSTDGGDSWGSPVRVNTDIGAAHQFFPWMDVDPFTGIIYVVFYDRRATIGDATEVWMARSEDGGETFINFPVSTVPFTPVDWIFFGDYINVAAREGKIYPIWMSMHNSDLSVWMAIVEEPVADVLDPPVRISTDLLADIPNPWRPGMLFTIDLPMAARLEMSLHDVTGRKVLDLIQGASRTGRHVLDPLRSDLDAGVYILRLAADRQSAQRKIVIVK